MAGTDRGRPAEAGHYGIVRQSYVVSGVGAKFFPSYG